jgi:hypothetical protein
VPKIEPSTQVPQAFRRGTCPNCGQAMIELAPPETPAAECARCGWLVPLDPIDVGATRRPTERTDAVSRVIVLRIVKVGAP